MCIFVPCNALSLFSKNFINRQYTPVTSHEERKRKIIISFENFAEIHKAGCETHGKGYDVRSPISVQSIQSEWAGESM